ncbi:glycerol transporter [Entomortierella beljakovae]|nr:glycerol transporter [Entomortierella beljakovae]
MSGRNEHGDVERRATGNKSEELQTAGSNSNNNSSTTTQHKSSRDRSTNPSLWNTKEFYFYYFVFVTVVPYMFKTAHDASSKSNPNYEKYEDLLSDGFFGYKVDDNAGLNRRWDVNFNFSMLRLVSFNLDYYWSLKQRQNQENIPKEDRVKIPETDKERVSTPNFAEDYNFFYYLAYALYAPLYVAGPIMTYNDFISQLRYPKDIPVKSLVKWVFRLFFCLFTMEFTMHYMHMVAISKRQAWDNDPTLQICMIGLFNLVLIWLKLMIIWRFFRLWALLDGIEAPENMIRCVINNYSALGFWRSWHKSYNLWILRYIYIPLGGTKNAIYNIWAVFTFVAVWHDIQLNLLAWGWLVSLFILPEIIASQIFSKKKWGKWPYYRHLCAVGAVGNIMLMMIANLVGFCIGVDGVKLMLYDLFSTAQGWLTMCGCFAAIFVCAQLQFEVREDEKRRGIFLNC